VRQHRLVEVDSAEAFDALGLAERDEAVLGAPQHRRVERAAAQVVDRDDLARVDALARRVVHRRGFGFGDELRAREPRELHGLTQQLDLVRPPVGGMRDGDMRGRSAVALGDLLDDLA
jgi:hypothetical protein